MTETYVMADMSSIAPLVESDDVKVLAFYIGGDTPNVPLLTQVKELGTRYLLPVWTRSDPENASVTTDAQAAIKHLAMIGAPKDCLVGLDYETAQDAAYVTDFSSILDAAGYRVLLYGSKDTVEKNPRPSGGYWDADWTGEPHLNEGSTATQYASSEQAKRPYDLSLADAEAAWWDTQSDTVTVTKVDEYVVELQKVLNTTWISPKLEVDGDKGPLTKAAFTTFMDHYSVIKDGTTGQRVQVLQAMLNTWWSIIPGHLVVDGNFGPLTLAAVETFQVKRDVADSVHDGKGDGQVGPDTKTALAV